MILEVPSSPSYSRILKQTFRNISLFSGKQRKYKIATTISPTNSNAPCTCLVSFFPENKEALLAHGSTVPPSWSPALTFWITVSQYLQGIVVRFWWWSWGWSSGYELSQDMSPTCYEVVRCRPQQQAVYKAAGWGWWYHWSHRLPERVVKSHSTAPSAEAAGCKTAKWSTPGWGWAKDVEHKSWDVWLFNHPRVTGKWNLVVSPIKSNESLSYVRNKNIATAFW